MPAVQKGFSYLFKGIQNVAMLMYVFATILTAVNAITRYAFHYVIYGSEELSSYVVLLMAFLMFPVLEASNKHLSVDIFATNCKNKKLVQIVYVIRGIISLGLFGIVSYYGLKVTATAVQYQSASPTLHIPKDIVFGITVASFIFAIIAWLAILLFNKRRPL